MREKRDPPRLAGLFAWNEMRYSKNVSLHVDADIYFTTVVFEFEEVMLPTFGFDVVNVIDEIAGVY